jgi:predicted small metal-binding protein
VFFNKETMLIVPCKEVGMDCDYIYKGKTEEEIMKNAD